MKKKTQHRIKIMPETGTRMTLKFCATTFAATLRTLTDILIDPHMQHMIKKYNPVRPQII
jgi:hypothetical protein